MSLILIIEDDSKTLANLALMLEMEGFRTRAARNGHEGLRLARSELPDLILCDQMMPELDGHGVLQALREDPATAGIPLIFLTAKSERSDLRDGMNAGADDYLTKPARGEEVLAAVRARLARKTAQEQAMLDRVDVRPDFSSPKPLQEKFGLTARESEVLLWVSQGKSNSEIAMILGNAEQTVKLHLNSIFGKMSVENRNAATVRALEVLSGPKLSERVRQVHRRMRLGRAFPDSLR